MKTKKSNLKLVNANTEAQTEEELGKKALAITEDRLRRYEAACLNSDELRAVLHRFIERVDQMLAEASFQFGGGLHGFSQDWSESPEPHEFIDLLHPGMKNDTERLEAALLEAEVRGDPEKQNLHDDYHALRMRMQETSYKLGVLTGIRLAGWSETKVRQMAEFLVDTLR